MRFYACVAKFTEFWKFLLRIFTSWHGDIPSMRTGGTFSQLLHTDYFVVEISKKASVKMFMIGFTMHLHQKQFLFVF